MRFYASKSRTTLNGRPYTPEKEAEALCINPYYKVRVENGKPFMIDSGAFQDVGAQNRVGFESALDRQLSFEKTVTPSGRPAELIVSYDRLVDEQYGERGQFKERVPEYVGEEYVRETVEAARWLAARRKDLEPRRLILSCQGTTTDQYMSCIRKVLDVTSPEDCIGFGGFCIISKSKAYEQQFYEVISQAFPLIAAKGIRRVHVFGVGMFRVLVQADMWARKNGLKCSYDTSAVELSSVFGRVFDPLNGMLAGVFPKEQKKTGYLPAEMAEFNTRMVTKFWSELGSVQVPDGFRPGMRGGAE